MHISKGAAAQTISQIKNHSTEKIFVFDGFFNFLSFQSQPLSDRNLLLDLPKMQGNSLALNSISFFE
jgi:hypothetical protein